MNVGLIGIGTVGGGTYKVLTENFQEIFNTTVVGNPDGSAGSR